MADSEREQDFCTYASVKIDDQVLPLAKAAAALAGLPVQDCISEVINEWASKYLGKRPLKRRPRAPRK